MRTDLALVTPDLFDRGGGIARIARATALACQRYCDAYGGRFHVYALHDKKPTPEASYLWGNTSYRVFGGNRRALAKAVVAGAWRRSHAGTIFCHPNLATLGLLYPVRVGTRRRRYSVVAHGVDAWNPLPFNRTLALRAAGEVWPVSAFTAERVSAVHGVPVERVRVIHNCLDPYWQHDEATPAEESPPFIFSLARLSEADHYKGIDTLIQAFGLIAGEFPEWELRIVGDGADLPRLRNIASSTSASARILFLGWRNDEFIMDAYERCALFALPSLKEGFGLVFLEAMAAAKPVVAAHATAVPEIVVDGLTGCLTPRGNVAALADALRRLARDPCRRRFMGVAGRKRVAGRFGFRRYADAIHRTVSLLWRPDVDWSTWALHQRLSASHSDPEFVGEALGANAITPREPSND